MIEDNRRAIVRTSGAFDARLADIERYWNRMDSPESFARLTEAMHDKVVPLLRRFPAIGRRVSNSAPKTVDALLTFEDIASLTDPASPAKGTVHEYVFDHYVLLYLLSDDVVFFLSLRHTREVSPDFDDLWGPEP